MSEVVDYGVENGIGVITIDHPPVNALSHAVRKGMLEAIRAAQDDDSLAVLLWCNGRTFIAGADITEFGKPLQEPWVPKLCNEIEASRKIVVAALHGTALGGGFETGLASHYRIAARTARVGLPEVKLGLMPGAGGTQRMPRLAGVEAALDMITSGKLVSATDAASLGLVDRVVDGDLRAAALAFAQELAAGGAPVRRTSERKVEPVAADAFDEWRAALAKRARGQNAPQRIVNCVEAAATLPFAEGLARERELFLECVQDPQSAAMRHLFFAEREAARIRGLGKDTPQREVRSVGIVGAGTMGGGIGMSFANAGIPVTLVEVSDEALARGLASVDRNYAGSVARGTLSEAGAADCRARITGATDYGRLSDADLVIEAVYEDPDLKSEVFAKLDATCKPGVILATNTSYQDINRIAAATDRPGDVLGLHFFSPANVMKLLEVVRADRTADDVLVTCMALAKEIGKVPVMSGACYGFIGNRMLGGYFREAQLCLIEGASPETVDTAMEDWGMAMGPIRVADLAGIDVGHRARQALPDDERGDPRAHRVPDALVGMGRLGQKTAAGFYNYDPDTRRRSSDPDVAALIEREAAALGIERRAIEPEEIVDRLVYALVNEGMRVLEEGIAQRPGDIDVVYVYGYGFPAWRGGPMHYADAVGLDRVLARIAEFRDRHGEANWRPAPLLERLVEGGQSIAAWSESRNGTAASDVRRYQ